MTSAPGHEMSDLILCRCQPLKADIIILFTRCQSISNECLTFLSAIPFNFRLVQACGSALSSLIDNANNLVFWCRF